MFVVGFQKTWDFFSIKLAFNHATICKYLNVIQVAQDNVCRSVILPEVKSFTYHCLVFSPSDDKYSHCKEG